MFLTQIPVPIDFVEYGEPPCPEEVASTGSNCSFLVIYSSVSLFELSECGFSSCLLILSIVIYIAVNPVCLEARHLKVYVI